MADPLSLSVGAIAVLIATKALEKTGEKLSESTWDLVSQFLAALRRKAPNTATAIEEVAQQPALKDQQPGDFGLDVLTRSVEKAARNDSEIQRAIQAIANDSEIQRAIVKEYYSAGKLAEQICVVVQKGANADFRGANFTL